MLKIGVNKEVWNQMSYLGKALYCLGCIRVIKQTQENESCIIERVTLKPRFWNPVMLAYICFAALVVACISFVETLVTETRDWADERKTVINKKPKDNGSDQY